MTYKNYLQYRNLYFVDLYDKWKKLFYFMLSFLLIDIVYFKKIHNDSYCDEQEIDRPRKNIQISTKAFKNIDTIYSFINEYLIWYFIYVFFDCYYSITKINQIKGSIFINDIFT